MAAKTEGRAYLLRGDDELRKHEALAELLKKLVAPDFSDFDLEQLEGDTATSDRVIAGLNIPPFSSSKRVVLIRFANKMNEDEQKRLAEKLPGAPESGCLILVNPAVERVDGRTKRGSEVVGELSRAVRKVGEVRDFGKMKPEGATRFARTLFEKAGKQVPADALILFVQRVGGDSSVIATEAQKLIDYSGDSARITPDDVEKVTCESPEERIFKLVDAIAAKNQAAALRFLGELFEQGGDAAAEAPRTLSMIARQFRLLWQAKALMDAGIRSFRKDDLSESARSMLPSSPSLPDVVSRQPWMVDRVTKQVRPFSRGELARCFTAISRADRMLKGIDGDIEDPRTVMELLVLDLARRVR